MDLDEKALDELGARTSLAYRDYVRGIKVADAARGLRELSAIANEVSHLPLK